MSIRLDPDVKAALHILAADQERSLSWIANRAMQQWLAEHRDDIAAAERRLKQKSKT